jgi:hypothetical protein
VHAVPPQLICRASHPFIACSHTMISYDHHHAASINQSEFLARLEQQSTKPSCSQPLTNLSCTLTSLRLPYTPEGLHPHINPNWHYDLVPTLLIVAYSFWCRCACSRVRCHHPLLPCAQSGSRMLLFGHLDANCAWAHLHGHAHIKYCTDPKLFARH